MDRREVGSLGEQPARPLLHVDESGSRAARRSVQPVETSVGRNGPGARVGAREGLMQPPRLPHTIRPVARAVSIRPRHSVPTRRSGGTSIIEVSHGRENP